MAFLENQMIFLSFPYISLSQDIWHRLSFECGYHRCLLEKFCRDLSLLWIEVSLCKQDFCIYLMRKEFLCYIHDYEYGLGSQSEERKAPFQKGEEERQQEHRSS